MDYLLNDAVESNMRPNENVKNVEVQMKSSFVIGIAILFIGFLFSWIGWRTFQTEIAVGIGMVIQLLGIVIFELIQSRCEISNKLITKRKFYAVGSWLICPFCVLFLSNTLLSLYPRPYSYWIGLLIPAIFYCTICVTITYILMTRKKSKE